MPALDRSERTRIDGERDPVQLCEAVLQQWDRPVANIVPPVAPLDQFEGVSTKKLLADLRDAAENSQIDELEREEELQRKEAREHQAKMAKEM